MNNKKIIFVIGPPGAGKGTQARLLVEKTGFYHFITSREGKDYIALHLDDPETAKQKELYDKGILFDPAWLLGVQKSRVKEILKQGVTGIVFDGSPRTLYEAENLTEFLSGLVGRENITVVVIEASVDEMKKRAGERLVCSKNENHVVSTRLDPGIKIGDKCSKCDGVLQKRDLDKEIEERVRQYQERTVPGIEFLRKNYKVFEINGEQSVEDVHKDIWSLLKPIVK